MFGFELSFLQALSRLRTPFLNFLFEAITILGEELIILGILVVLYFAFDKHFALRLFYFTIASTCVNNTIKNIARVPRPFTRGVTPLREGTATGYSFPSGHTQSFSAWSTTLALRFKKRWFSILVGTLIALVAFSRLYLGVHYPSDVIVGVLLGVGLPLVGNLFYDKVKSKHLLFLYSALVILPFAVGFLFREDPMSGDLYKTFGMLVGLAVAAPFEARFAPITYDVPAWKKTARIVIALIVALVVKEGIKLILVTDLVWLELIFHTLRYFLLVFAELGLLPLLFKKTNL